MEGYPRPRVIAALVAGLAAGYGIAIPVGAVGAYLVSLTARTSLGVGAGAALGVATADGGYALAAVVGGSALTDAIAPIAALLRWASAVVLCGLAALVAATGVRRYRAGEPAQGTVAGTVTSPLRAYLSLLGITVLNPTTVVYFAALVLGGQATVAATPVTAAVFVLAAFAASASWQLVLAAGGSLVGHLVTGRRGRLATALVSSAVILALALTIVV